MPWNLLIAPFMAWLLVAGLLYWMIRYPPGWLPLAYPNARSLHQHPIPRAGGLALLGGASSAWLLAGVADAVWLLPALGLATVSWLDDRRGLPVSARLLAQTVAAGMFLLLMGEGDMPWTVLIGLPVMVWMSNLYNFMDGSDGLAGGMTVFGFGFYALAAGLGGELQLAMVCLVLLAAALGFLHFNFHPARVFMGDVGSVPLGFMAAALGYSGWQSGLWPASFPLLVFSPFIVDASVTLAKRAWAGEKVWQAHNKHYYQRLVRMGWGHRRTALAEYGLMLACGVTALVGLRTGYMVSIGLGWLGIYVLLMSWIDRRWAALGGETV